MKVTIDNIHELLKDDTKIKVAGVDVDGILRGKIISKKKFLSVAEDGFGMCSVIYGWDMHDQTYFKELKISNSENGYRDMRAIVDLSSYRRIPWENDVPFFLLSFFDPDTNKPVSACPRSLLKTTAEKFKSKGISAMAGAEYEFFQFRSPSSSLELGGDRSAPSTASFFKKNPVDALPTLTDAMMGYSITDPLHNQDYFYGIYDTCSNFDCEIESWHSESGPSVFEAAIGYSEIQAMADKACLFKYVVKSLGIKYGITPCFMAKPRADLPGNSGHMHVSLVDKKGNNLLARDSPDEDAPYPDVANLSDLGRHFLAGILDGLPDVMPLLAPTINSYKRLVENFWAPVTVSWGFEHRAASIRLIGSPSSSSKSTRFEVRVAGADANPFYVLAAILALGWRGVDKKLEIPIPPMGQGKEGQEGGRGGGGVRLAKSLREATTAFMRKGSVAREIFGDEFVEHYGGTREHEIRLWDEAVTDWEMKRYIEIV